MGQNESINVFGSEASVEGSAVFLGGFLDDFPKNFLLLFDCFDNISKICLKLSLTLGLQVFLSSFCPFRSLSLLNLADSFRHDLQFLWIHPSLFNLLGLIIKNTDRMWHNFLLFSFQPCIAVDVLFTFVDLRSLSCLFLVLRMRWGWSLLYILVFKQS